MPVCISDARPGGKIRYEWTNGKGGGFHLTGEYLELEPYSRIVHVERMYLPDPTPDNHIETRFDAGATGTPDDNSNDPARCADARSHACNRNGTRNGSLLRSTGRNAVASIGGPHLPLFGKCGFALECSSITNPSKPIRPLKHPPQSRPSQLLTAADLALRRKPRMRFVPIKSADRLDLQSLLQLRPYTFAQTNQSFSLFAGHTAADQHSRNRTSDQLLPPT